MATNQNKSVNGSSVVTRLHNPVVNISIIITLLLAISGAVHQFAMVQAKASQNKETIKENMEETKSDIRDIRDDLRYIRNDIKDILKKVN